MPTGLGDEQLWISATNDNTGASTALNDLSASSKAQYSGSGVTVAADTSEGGTYALSFNGASTRSWQYTPSLQTNGGYFGWSVWFKADAFNSAMSIAGGNSWSSQKGGLLLVDGSGNLILNLSKGTNGVPNVAINYAASLNTGQWYHAAATGDGTTARLYLDGVEVGSGAFTGFPTSWERFMRLGSAGAGSGDNGYGTDSLFFDGLIDDARFYDRTLTQTDITHLSSSRGVTGPSYSGLGGEQLWLSATNNNTGTSTAFQDQSGNGNDGIAVGTLVVADTSEGGSYAFDFSNASLQKISVGTLDLTGLSNFTWSAWIYDDSSNAASTHSTFFSWATNATQPDLLFYNYQRSKLAFQINDGADGGNEYAQVNFQNWHHYCVTFDGSNPVATDRLKYYLDGAVQTPSATFSYPATLGSTGTNMGAVIGAYVLNPSSIFYFNGRQDDIRAYDRTLTQAEITHLASQRGVEGPPPVGLGDETNWYCPSLNEGADITGNASFAIGSNTIVSDTGSGGTNALSFGTVSTSTMDQATDHYGGLADISNSVWIKIDVNNSPNLYTYGSSSKRNPWVFCNPTYLYFQTNVYSEVNTPSNGVWVHFCFVKSGTTQRLYVDGSLASTDACQATTYTNTNGNFVFNSVAKGGFHIDDFRGYTRALTQAEITHLAEARGIEGPPPVGLGDEQLWLCPSLNDSANDISGNGNDGTYNGGMGTVVDTGEGGSLAYDFDGTDDYIDCGAVFRPTGNFSISFWVLNDSATKNVMYVSKNWDGTSEGYVSRYDGGAGPLKFYTYSSGITYGTDVANPFTTSQWSCVTNVYNGTHWEIYIDGVLASQTAQTQPPYDSPSGLWIGATSVGGWNLDGRMDDIRMFDRALTQAEITHLASQRGVEGPPPVGLGDEQLWLCPSLNDSPNDISGNGNDGTYNGGMGTITDTSNGGSLAYQFDGTNDYIDCGSSASLDKTSDDPVSQSGWVKVVETTNTQFILLPKSLGGNTYIGTHLTIKNGLLSLRLINTLNSNELQVETGTTLTTGWHHIAFSYDGSLSSSGVSIYLDGASQSLSAITSTLVTGSPVTFVGGSMLVSTRSSLDFTPDNGTLQDDLRLFNRVLTQSEITHLATSRGIQGPAGTPPVTPDVFFNPFQSKTFFPNYTRRIR